MEVRTVELPLTSLADDIDAVTAAIERARSPVLLCGHSYGGMVISVAGNHPHVKRLVYLTAVVPSPGQNMSQAAKADESQLRAPGPDFVDGFLVYSAEAAVPTFYEDCSVEDVDTALSLLRPTAPACFTEVVERPAWQDRPATYIVGTRDRAFDPEVQRRMARGIADVREWDTGHSPFLSRPAAVSGLLLEQAALMLRDLDVAHGHNY
jgi:pimeloyl-ACP methyl ester carboxylesterase